jgi:hypothetical protein
LRVIRALLCWRLLCLSSSGPSSCLYSPDCVERLSEKGYEQYSERGFGKRREAKMGRRLPFRCSVRLHCRLFRPFSDSLRIGILRSSYAERRLLKTLVVGLLLGAVGMLALQVLLVWGFFAVSNQDPFILNPNSGSLKKNGLTMVMFCGSGHTPDGRGSGALEQLPPEGKMGGWSRGREV